MGKVPRLSDVGAIAERVLPLNCDCFFWCVSYISRHPSRHDVAHPSTHAVSFMAKKSSSLPLGVGIIGCGNISNAYFKHTAPFSEYIKFVSCADIDVDRAKAKAAEHGLSKGYSVKELLAD